jgi:gliding motility-associated-like protein
MLCPEMVFGQLACPTNVDLELGNLTSWNFFIGTNAGTGSLGTMTATAPLSGRHSLTSGGGTDLYGHFPIVAPGGGNYSLKIGNRSTGADIDQARYVLTVPTGINNYSLIYRYAVVFEDPQHTTAQQPFFQVRVYNQATGAVINCGSFTYVAQSGIPGFLSTAANASLYYKPWSTASLNLSGQAGNTVVIEFTASDCAQGAHFGYGYVDMSCGLFAITNNNCSSSATTPLSAPAGFQSYTWYNSNYSAVVGSGQSITIATPASSTNYHVVLTPYPGFGCADTLTTSVNITSLGVSAGPDTTVCNSASVTLQASANGTGAPFAYSWSPAAGLSCTTCASPAASPAATTDYVLTVTDANGCIKKDTVKVAARMVVTASAQSNPCSGAGSVTATAGSGTPPYTYAWNTTPAQTSATAGGLTAGTYIVTATDSKGCTDTQSVALSQPAAFTAGISASANASCHGGNNGSAAVSVSGGAAPYTYSWSTTPVQTSATAAGLAAGSYTVTVRDANGCSDTALAAITEPAGLAIQTSSTAPGCTVGTGTATGVASGGTAPYSYSWNTSPVQTSATAAGLSAGSYVLTVTDAANCSTTSTVTLALPSALQAAIAATAPATCFGSHTGAATATVSGGKPPFAYSWNTTPAQTGATALNLAAGSYAVTVTDSNGCTKTLTTTITQPGPLSVSAAGIDVSCHGGFNGRATAAPSGGTAPYTFSWSTTPVQTAATAIGLTSGSYTVTVTDANGCSANAAVAISQPAALAISNTQTDVSCFGGANGTATVSAAGGAAPYSYQWNTIPAQHSAAAIGLPAGTYTVTVTDTGNCTATATVNIAQPPAVTATMASTDASCHGGMNGTATVNASGGAAPYTYQWNTSPAQTSATAVNLAAGAYSVTVTDSNGCATTAAATINQPAIIAATAANTDVSCYGGSNGKIWVAASGGTAPYVYSWNTSPAQSADTAFGVGAGTYTATVTDSRGCAVTASATVLQPAALSIATTHTNILCSGGAGGSATALPTGGTAPYTYSWNSAPVQTTSTAAGLPAGSHTVTVTDLNGCIATASVTLTQPPLLTAATAKTDVACSGGANGTATVVPSGGNAPYTYSWNTLPAQTTATAAGLPAGSYTVTIADSAGCTAAASVNITQPQAITITTSRTDVACFGQTNGTATAAAAGGTPPYAYSWSTSPVQASATAAGLPAGSYTATVTDAKGCTASASVSIAQPTMLNVVTAQTGVSCKGGTNGSATVVPSGGIPPYTYRWSTTPAQTGVAATNLAAGTYTVTVTDSSGCTKTATVSITEPAALSAAAAGTNVGCHGGTNGTATVTASGGTSPYAYSWNTTPAQITTTAAGLTAGSYTATVTDANNCMATASVTITQPAALTIAHTKTDASCFGSANGTATISPSGGSLPYSYSWNTSPAQAASTATGLPAGTYQVTVTDGGGCTIAANVTVNQPALLTGNITTTALTCYGNKTGAATAGVSGGTGPYTYSWNTVPVQTAATITNLAAGAYTLSVTDAHGCSLALATTVAQPSQLVTAVNVTNARCYGGTGAATQQASGGTPPYTYAWSTSPVQATAAASALAPGSYTATVVDANGCTSSAVALITAPAPVILSDTTLKRPCQGAADGVMSVRATGGTAPFSYLWHTTPAKAGPTAYNLAPGSYTISTVDAWGCTDTASVMLQSMPIDVHAMKDDSLCRGSAVNLAAGGALSYRWYPAAGLSCIACANPVATPAVTTVYTVVGTDSNKCADSAAVVLTVIQRVPVSVGPSLDVCQGGEARLQATGGIAYKWSPGASLSDSTAAAPLAGPVTATTGYKVIITENECFSDTLTQTVVVRDAPELKLEPDFRGIPGVQVPLKVYSAGATRITWTPSTGLSCNDCFTPTATLAGTITYVAHASNNTGCVATDTLTITVGCDGTSFFMANVFTPNADGQNDRFYPQGKGLDKVSRFLIYDRWGEIVFAANNMDVNVPEKGWDGTFNGRILKPDVYLYVIQAVCSDGSSVVVKGDVTIIR